MNFIFKICWGGCGCGCVCDGGRRRDRHGDDPVVIVVMIVIVITYVNATNMKCAARAGQWELE